jgi:transposase InsO family protein
VRWAVRKYKRFRGHTKAVCDWLRALKRRNPNCSLIGAASNLRPDDWSWMNREVHVQFWEGVGLRCPALLAYLKAYQNVAEARHSIAAYFELYNDERLHQALGYRSPCQVFEEAMRFTELRRGEKPLLIVS